MTWKGGVILRYHATAGQFEVQKLILKIKCHKPNLNAMLTMYYKFYILSS